MRQKQRKLGTLEYCSLPPKWQFYRKPLVPSRFGALLDETTKTCGDRVQTIRRWRWPLNFLLRHPPLAELRGFLRSLAGFARSLRRVPGPSPLVRCSYLPRRHFRRPAVGPLRGDGGGNHWHHAGPSTFSYINSGNWASFVTMADWKCAHFPSSCRGKPLFVLGR